MSKKCGRPLGVARTRKYEITEDDRELLVIEPDEKIEENASVKLKRLPNLLRSPSFKDLIDSDLTGIVKSTWDTKFGKQVQVKYDFRELPDNLLFTETSRIVVPEAWLDAVLPKKTDQDESDRDE